MVTKFMQLLSFLVIFSSCGRGGQDAEALIAGTLNIPSDIINHMVNHDDERDDIKELKDAMTDLETELDTLKENEDLLQEEINELQITLTEIKLGIVVDLIDPCGDYVGHYDEIILLLGSGQYVAYFEQGGKRFLSVLPNGNYRTTDVQACNFSIVNGVYTE